jgi:hypothetical protein
MSTRPPGRDSAWPSTAEHTVSDRELDVRISEQLKQSLTREGGPDEAAVGRLRDFAHSLLRDGADGEAETVPEPGN